MAQACAEVLPEERSSTGIVRREEHREHEEETAEACRTHEDTGNEREPNRQFTVGDQESDAGGVREDEAAEDGHHERISASIEEFVDPELKSAVESKCCPEDFVFAEDQEKNTYANAEQGQRIAVPRVGI